MVQPIKVATKRYQLHPRADKRYLHRLLNVSEDLYVSSSTATTMVSEVIVCQTMSEAPLDTFGPGNPMPTPISACLREGASANPVPGHGHGLPLDCQALIMRNLVLQGRYAGVD